MKDRLRRGLAILIAMIAVMILTLPSAYASPKADLYIGIQGPAAFTPDRPQDSSLQVMGGLAITRLPMNLKLTCDVEHSLRQGDLFDKEDKLKVGASLPLAPNLIAYTFWERRFTIETDRLVVGVRANISLFP